MLCQATVTPRPRLVPPPQAGSAGPASVRRLFRKIRGSGPGSSTGGPVRAQMPSKPRVTAPTLRFDGRAPFRAAGRDLGYDGAPTWPSPRVVLIAFRS
jgi:hypothetical protein